MSPELQGSEYPRLNLAPYEEITGVLKFIERGEEFVYIELSTDKFKMEIGTIDLVTEYEDLEEGEYAIISILSTPHSERPYRVRLESTDYIVGDLRNARWN